MLFDAHRDPTNYILGDIHYAQHSCSLQTPHVLKRVFPFIPASTYWNLQHIEKYHLIPNISHILRYFPSSPTFDTEKKSGPFAIPWFTFSNASQVVFASNHHLLPPSPPNFYRPSNEGSSTAIVRATLERKYPKTETHSFFDEKIGCPSIIQHAVDGRHPAPPDSVKTL